MFLIQPFLHLTGFQPNDGLSDDVNQFLQSVVSSRFGEQNEPLLTSRSIWTTSEAAKPPHSILVTPSPLPHFPQLPPPMMLFTTLSFC